MSSALVFLLQAPVEAAEGQNLIVEILTHSSFAALAIMAIVSVLGLVSIAVGIERFFYFSGADKESREFAGKVKPLLDQGKLEDAVKIAKGYKRGHLPRLVARAIESFLGGLNKGIDPVDLANRAADREISAFGDEMRRWMSIMGTTGATSPFIGLLGTVVGIIVTFQDIKKAGNASISAVSGGISEALIATAIGLLAAIPAVMLYNFFAGKADKLTSDLASAGAEVIDTCRLASAEKLRNNPYRG
jgi:biopolymer transport protein ExbB/biopolymer transport protein TolQ